MSHDTDIPRSFHRIFIQVGKIPSSYKNMRAMFDFMMVRSQLEQRKYSHCDNSDNKTNHINIYSLNVHD